MQIKKKIGIIGGSGPQSSCQLYSNIIQDCQQNYGCRFNHDFPEIFLVSHPFSLMTTINDFNRNKSTIINELQHCFDTLARNNVDIIGVACNTVHSVLPHITLPETAQFLHIVQATEQYALSRNIKKMLVLSTATTASFNLYASSERMQYINVDDHDMERVDAVIKKIFAGILQENDARILQSIVSKYHEQHAFDGVLLGCTELPLLHAQHSVIAPELASYVQVLDTLMTLGKGLTQEAFASVSQEDDAKLAVASDQSHRLSIG